MVLIAAQRIKVSSLPDLHPRAEHLPRPQPKPTQARRISYADSLLFEQIHRDSYRAHGYELIDIPAAPATERAEAIIKTLDHLG